MIKSFSHVKNWCNRSHKRSILRVFNLPPNLSGDYSPPALINLSRFIKDPRFAGRED